MFDGPGKTAEELGWQGDAGWQVVNGELRSPENVEASMIAKRTPSADYEMVANVRLLESSLGGRYGFMLAITPERAGPMLSLGSSGDGWELIAGNRAHEETWRLPPAFDPLQPQQWRFRAADGKVTVSWEAIKLGELALDGAGRFIGFVATQAVIAVEMVRVVGLNE